MYLHVVIRTKKKHLEFEKIVRLMVITNSLCPRILWRHRGNPAMATIRSVNGTWLPSRQRFYHIKMAHILVSVYSVFFQPHSTSEPITNNIHIIGLVYTCIITSSDSSLAPSLSMTYCTPSDHLLHLH